MHNNRERWAALRDDEEKSTGECIYFRRQMATSASQMQPSIYSFVSIFFFLRRAATASKPVYSSAEQSAAC